MTDGRTDGWGRLQYPHRILKKRGDNMIIIKRKSIFFIILISGFKRTWYSCFDMSLS